MSAERCQTLIYSLLEYTVRPEFSGQMEIARELHSMATGQVTDEDSFFESRMAVFQQYFLFDYRLSDIFSGATVFETFLMSAQKKLSASELADYEQLRSVRRSIFRVEKRQGDSVVVTDLLSRRRTAASSLPDYCLTGFDAGRIFESRVVSFMGRLYFSGAFIFHPEEVADLIEQHIREFVIRRTRERTTRILDWRGELKRRHEILAGLADQKRTHEHAERKKPVELLNINRNIAQVAIEVSSPNLVMSLGLPEVVSVFVPETPFYDTSTLLDLFSYSELRCNRYKHIIPRKIY